ncbi:BREX-2 system adenine-specific DNA-methyltransferase PglX [Streptomyces sp. NBC_00378]|uniref:BREX-2 system adenine-specific DNA-methyltransferase PglX n=1 Tax=Streptomyces sp. NBC_00378 TaxID=2975732 RepID=UPI00224F53E7|nr:BREX-2 system adenine-specific DNA-methyltransferase PglX [Streptomyces sp. NBC_00378]MCX5108398.1 BREX-2 system adenine-specific DNA-methyltransferase PglX [Streptomyces sp. NBC_00378]
MDKAALLKDLRKQVTALEDDLRARTESVDEYRTELEREYAAAREANRTAATYGAWRDERVTQAAAAWVLATVFVRFCEDNSLVDDPFIAGPGERLADAEDRQAAFFREKPELNDRDWLVAGFDHLSGAHKAVAGLFDRGHNALWELSPSYEAATRLLGFWRERGADGEIIHDFTDGELDTRFLGDLYQDLSEHARKTYALLQTPEFVEEFILDLTLEPAVEEFGLDPAWKHKPAGWPGEEPVVRGLRCIDPACGSGHFLLGMFERLLKKWREAEPGTEDWELVRRSLESVHGCDKNPFAVAIARFRMLVAVLKACGERRLAAAPEFPINVAVGDSLLHGRGAETVTETLFSGAGDEERTFAFRTEDVWEFAERVDLLGRGSYHVVVGNPPYITVKDKQENENYRKAYEACAGKYALSVPFVQRIFELAVRAGGDRRDGGFTGQITANSFMKREFGKKLIEEVLPKVDLTHVIDTSGAYIPGHGTPTVILAGRNRIGLQANRIRAVLGVRGEAGVPENAALGVVWRSIVALVDKPGSESGWVSITDRGRDSFSVYPWSLSGGGAEELFEAIEHVSNNTVGTFCGSKAGFAGFSGVDDVFYLPPDWHRRFGTESNFMRPVAVGDELRDWRITPANVALAPYSPDGTVLEVDVRKPWAKGLWGVKQSLGSLADFSGKTRFDAGIPWWSWYRWTQSRAGARRTVVMAKVATHNHAVLNALGVVTTQHMPAVAVSEDISDEAVAGVVALLNSSVACFWLKQVSQSKGNGGIGGGISDELWEHRYEFTGANLQDFPLPEEVPLDIASSLDSLARRLTAYEPISIAKDGAFTRGELGEAQSLSSSTLARMISLQEELDWAVYGAYALLSSNELSRTIFPGIDNPPPISLGERAFEIVLARKMASGEAETTWFDRHGAMPRTTIPAHWPEEYKKVVQARIEIINSRKDIALMERPDCKRRWASVPWEKKEKEALRAWLLNRCEDENLWFTLRDGFRAPRTLTVSQLADALRQDDDVQAVAELYAANHMGKRDATLATVLADIITPEHVPHLAAERYKDSGLRKREQWEQVWELQREEDKAGKRLDIPVPPKYTSADFLKASYWSHRGKLDVPKERFISYPDASPDSDPTLLLGWAGWDHKDQVQALINMINDRTEQAGWETSRLTPLIAGIQELMPWVHQWHGEYDAEWDGTPAEEYQAYLDEQRAKHGLSAEDLAAWRPEKKTRGRAKKAD